MSTFYIFMIGRYGFFITRSIHIQKKTTNDDDDNNKKHTRNLSHGSRSVMAQKTT